MTSKPVKFSVKLTDNSGAWFNHQTSRMNKALGIMANTIVKQSQMVVPQKDKTLRDSVIVRQSPAKATVIYPGPYAGYQERGERRDGSYKVKHYSTSGTGKNYLQKSGNAIVERGIRWFLSHS